MSDKQDIKRYEADYDENMNITITPDGNGDYVLYTSHLQELDKLKAEHLKAMEEQREKFIEYFNYIKEVSGRTGEDAYIMADIAHEAILNATIEDKDND